MAPVSLLYIILISSRLALFHSAVGKNRETTILVHPSTYCGKLGKLEFPFTNKQPPECGLYLVDECTESVQKIQLESGGGKWYEVVSVFQNSTILIHDQVLQKCGIHNQFDSSYSLGLFFFFFFS